MASRDPRCAVARNGSATRDIASGRMGGRRATVGGMKLHGVIEIRVEGEQILRAPRFWDRLKKRFGGEPDLRTGSVRARLEAQAVVDAARQAFNKLGATNAVSLVIDDQVLFQDRDSNEDDLGDLFLAFHEHAPVFDTNFSLLRLAIEHEEAGLHHVIEIIARAEHPEDDPAARVVIGARIREFDPRPGEAAEAYRARVEPLTRTPATIETARVAFDSFVARVADALRTVMPEADVRVHHADARVQKPSRRESERQPVAPTDPRYDPHDAYYPDPMYGVLSGLMWMSLFTMPLSPGIMVIDHHGHEAGQLDDADAHAADDGGHEGDAGDDGGGEDGGDFDDAGGYDDGGGFDGDFGGDW
jgi:hypothetical protein